MAPFRDLASSHETWLMKAKNQLMPRIKMGLRLADPGRISLLIAEDRHNHNGEVMTWPILGPSGLLNVRLKERGLHS